MVRAGAGGSGTVLTSQGAAANPHWAAAGAGTVTSASVVTANGFTGTVATATTTPAITLTCSASGLLTGNGTAITAAADLAVGAAGQLNFTAIAQPGSQVTGDVWYDSTQLCLATFVGSATSADCLTGYLSRVIYVQTAAVTIASTSGNSSLVSTTGAIGTVSLPAGFLNVKGRTLRLVARGYSASASSPGSFYLFLKLGSNTIASMATITPTASGTNQVSVITADITVETTGSSGTINTYGLLQVANAGAGMLAAGNDPSGIANSTTAGSYNATNGG